MNRLLKTVSGIGIGGALVYLLDPNRGKARRAKLRDKLTKTQHQTEDAIRKTSRHLSNRAHGLASEVSSRFHSESVPDEKLVARVRSEIGRVTERANAIQVSADHGRITLSGLAPATEIGNLIAHARLVRGVQEVRSELQADRSSMM